MKYNLTTFLKLLLLVMKNNISEEKKQEIREKNRLAAQRRRANLSEDQKKEAREKNKLAMQERRAKLPRTIQSDNTDDNKVGEKRHVIEDESEVEDEDEDEDEDEVNPLTTDWKLYRERRNAQSRISKRARYARLKEAEAQLKEMTTVGENCAIKSGDDNDIQQLQLLANKRQQLLAYGRQNSQNYRQLHPNQQRRWIAIQQTWDEDNPCR